LPIVPARNFLSGDEAGARGLGQQFPEGWREGESSVLKYLDYTEMRELQRYFLCNLGGFNRFWFDKERDFYYDRI